MIKITTTTARRNFLSLICPSLFCSRINSSSGIARRWKSAASCNFFRSSKSVSSSNLRKCLSAHFSCHSFCLLNSFSSSSINLSSNFESLQNLCIKNIKIEMQPMQYRIFQTTIFIIEIIHQKISISYRLFIFLYFITKLCGLFVKAFMVNI